MKHCQAGLLKSEKKARKETTDRVSMVAPEARVAEAPVHRYAATAHLLRLMKVLYFLSGFSASSFGRFATLFYLDSGLDAHRIGIVGGPTPPA